MGRDTTPRTAAPGRGFALAAACLLIAAESAVAQCGDPLAGPCCSPHDNGFCSSQGCCELICNTIDPFCCVQIWDSACAAIAVEVCGGLCADDYLPEPSLQQNAAYGVAVDWSEGPGSGIDPLVAVGSYLRSIEDPPLANAGSMSILRRIDGVWVDEALLFPEPPIAATYFGRSVAVMQGPVVDVAIAGAYRDSQVGPANNQRGAAHVFVSSEPGTWTASTVLRPGSGAVNTEWFGFSVDAGHVPTVNADQITVGAPRAGFSNRGAVYIFGRSGKAWNQLAKVVPPNSSSYNSSQFGWSIGFEPDLLTGLNGVPLPQPQKLLIVGAPGYSSERGRVFVQERRTAENWQNSVNKTITIGGLQAGDRYGEAVAVASRFVAIGIPGRFEGRGGVQMWERIGNTSSNWKVRTLILDDDAIPGTRFGSAVSMREWGNGQILLAVGAKGDSTEGPATGAVSFYLWTPGDSGYDWIFLGKRHSVAPEDGAQFGFAVAAGDIETVVGVPFQNTTIIDPDPKPHPVTLWNTGAVEGVFP